MLPPSTSPVNSGALQTGGQHPVLVLLILLRRSHAHRCFRNKISNWLHHVPCVRIRSIQIDLTRPRVLLRQLQRKIQAALLTCPADQPVVISMPFAIRGDFLRTNGPIDYSHLQMIFRQPRVVGIASEPDDIFTHSYFPGNCGLDLCRVSSALTSTFSVVVLFFLGVSKSQIMRSFA